MRLSFPVHLVLIVLFAISLAVIPASENGYYGVVHVLTTFAVLILSMTIAMPFICASAHRHFWIGYACSAGLFAILANSMESNVFYAVREVSGWFTILVREWVGPGNFSLTLQFILVIWIPFCAGIISGTVIEAWFKSEETHSCTGDRE